MTSNEANLRRDLDRVVDDHRDHVGDSEVVQALEAQIDRVRDSEGNRGLGEWAT